MTAATLNFLTVNEAVNIYDAAVLSLEADGSKVSEESLTKNSQKRLKLQKGRHEYVVRVEDQASNKSEVTKTMGCYPNKRFTVDVMGGAKEVLKDCVAATLASAELELSLPALESRIRELEARQVELYKLTCALQGGEKYDEEIGRIHKGKMRLIQLKTELEMSQHTNSAADNRMAKIEEAVANISGSITEYYDVQARQLISSIKVMDKESILVRFKDGREIKMSI